MKFFDREDEKRYDRMVNHNMIAVCHAISKAIYGNLPKDNRLMDNSHAIRVFDSIIETIDDKAVFDRIIVEDEKDAFDDTIKISFNFRVPKD